jgi:hypothetical protein
MTDETTLPPTPARRWFQFSLRSLFLLMLLTAAFLAGRASQWRELQALRAEQQQLQALSHELVDRLYTHLAQNKLEQSIDPSRDDLTRSALEFYHAAARDDDGHRSSSDRANP